jgi:acetyl-CoA/propionyl-CoA carboxylase biotin carboxyl carrier protein
VEGVATTVPADKAILEHPDFIAAEHSTKWVEDHLDLSEVAAPAAPAPSEDGEDPKVQRDVDVEVDGRRYQVKVWVPETAGVAVGAAAAPSARPKRGASASAGAGAGAGTVMVPMQGTIVKVLVAEGDTVEAGQALCVLEAMKMENNINADKDGVVKELRVEPGASVGSGDVIAVIE